MTRQIEPMAFFSQLRWLDGRPLADVVEPYRRALFAKAYEYTGEVSGPGTASRVNYNLILAGKAKKNWKSADLALWSLYKLLFWKSWNGNQIYTLCNDEDQAGDDLELGKKIIERNPALKDKLKITRNVIERRDGKGFWEILPAGDVKGAHGKTYLLCTFDEIHGYKNWDILEAMQLDPSRPDAQMWITSYASLHHRPGVPLFDLTKLGREKRDPRMLFSWYASDYTTDPAFQDATPEQRANPSMSGWQDQNYLVQQKTRLPSHKFRRLHLNLPGLPEGSAFSYEMIDSAIEKDVRVRPPRPETAYTAFVDMSGGSSDDACLAIAHKERDRAVLDCVVNQGPQPPFDPMVAVAAFAKVLKQYRCFHVTGDKYAGETFSAAFQKEGISYQLSQLTKSEIYSAVEPKLNSGQVVLLDHEVMESQFLGLVWRGGKIDHPPGEHDDWANAAGGAIQRVAFGDLDLSMLQSFGSRTFEKGTDWGDTPSTYDHPVDWVLDQSRGRKFWDS